ncbi:hypothetical protein F4819DRAFT_508301 [Hypoxylon fuscum]|nr:hypothetical protein F4819DRAFT_508301 [Hypoxylon fuscum]
MSSTSSQGNSIPPVAIVDYKGSSANSDAPNDTRPSSSEDTVASSISIDHMRARQPTTHLKSPIDGAQECNTTTLQRLSTASDAVIEYGIDEESADSGDGAGSNQHASSPILSDKSNLRLPLRKSLGFTAISTLLGGSLLVILVISILVFLWVGEGPTPGGTKAPELWRTIMLRDWAIRTITISSVVLRVLTMAQASICSSLVAALLIEGSQIPLSLTAHLSITRAINTSPRELLQAMLLSRANAILIKIELLLLVVLALTTFGIQFSSTILLSDVNTTRLVEYPEQFQFNASTSSERIQGLLQTLKETDKLFMLEGADFPTSGKLKLSNVTIANEHGISDSGLTRQAYLPFGQEDRTKTCSYDGLAVVADVRVSCLRPSLSAKIVRIAIVDVKDRYSTWGVNGTISYEESYRQAGIDSPEICRQTDGYVDCLSPNVFSSIMTVPSTWKPGNPEWTTFARPVSFQNASLGNSWDIQQTPLDFSSGSTPFFIFATNLNESCLDNDDMELPLESPKGYREWNSYEILPNVFFNATLCFVGLHTSISQVQMERDVHMQEPNIVLSVARDFTDDEVEGVLSFVGANNLSNEQGKRGILSISSIKEIAATSGSDTNQGFPTSRIPEFLNLFHMANLQAWFSDGSDGICVQLCIFCTGFTSNNQLDLEAMFNHVINSGGQLAPTFAIFLTVLFQRSYYYVTREFDTTGYIQVAFSNEYNTPRNWGGLSAVIVLVVVHLLCVFGIVGLFVTRVRYTMQGNIWHTVSQLISSDTESILKQSNEAKDNEVQKLLQSNDVLVTLARSSTNGNVSVIKHVEHEAKSMDISEGDAPMENWYASIWRHVQRK